jgi:hypothetical protein
MEPTLRGLVERVRQWVMSEECTPSDTNLHNYLINFLQLERNITINLRINSVLLVCSASL